MTDLAGGAPPGASRHARSRLGDIPAPTVHLWLMLTLTFTTGVNDAVGYLGLDKVFTGNMTGNVVIGGMALAGAEGLPILGPALALVGFMAGAAVAGRTLRTVAEPWTGRTTALLASVAAMMLGLAAALIMSDSLAHPLMVTSTTIAAAGMGIQAAVARHIGVKDVTTVVVTSTITGLAADSRLGAGRPGSTGRRALAVVAIALGATAGALSLRVHPGAGLAGAGLIIAAVTVVGHRHAAATRRAR